MVCADHSIGATDAETNRLSVYLRRLENFGNVCVELNREYCCWGQKRLLQTSSGDTIQGYTDGVFWERNTAPQKPKKHQQRQ